MLRKIASLSSLPDGGSRVVELDGMAVALFRHGGRVYALENECPHRGAGLESGELRDGIVYCPVHAWPFELGTGRCVDVPGACVRSFPVRVEGDDVLVEL